MIFSHILKRLPLMAIALGALLGPALSALGASFKEDDPVYFLRKGERSLGFDVGIICRVVAEGEVVKIKITGNLFVRVRLSNTPVYNAEFASDFNSCAKMIYKNYGNEPSRSTDEARRRAYAAIDAAMEPVKIHLPAGGFAL